MQPYSNLTGHFAVQEKNNNTLENMASSAHVNGGPHTPDPPAYATFLFYFYRLLYPLYIYQPTVLFHQIFSFCIICKNMHMK